MLTKTRNFYRKLLSKFNDNNIRKINLNIDYEKFKELLLRVQDGTQLIPSLPDTINGAFKKAVFYVQPFSDPKKLFIDFIADSLYNNNYFSPLVFILDYEILFYYINSEIKLPSVISGIQNFLMPYVNMTIDIQSYPEHKFKNIIESRSNSFYDKYSLENNPVLYKVWNKLSDDISRISFSEYLNQRYKAYIHAQYEVIYPGKPPAQTSSWREERQRMGIPVPKLEGVTPDLLSFFHHHIFVMEQYAVPGCSAEENDVVVDAGAFIGDTSIYFSKKVGQKGTVYAFEPIPTNISNLKETIRLNGAEMNTVVVPYALSDEEKKLSFLSNYSVSSSIDKEEELKIGSEKELFQVNAISLDQYVKKNSINHVDFLKADLEGADIDFLIGSRETIKKFSPKCGLVVYHKPDDIIDIPRILLECQPDYKFYFRMEAEPIIFATL